jgi:hypothetical protein
MILADTREKAEIIVLEARALSLVSTGKWAIINADRSIVDIEKKIMQSLLAG